ncbi:MAG: M23 family metallopeptidase [Myxococcales bacterium]|nr:M23 family metallopeptidase [Myxococcales bacterium]
MTRAPVLLALAACLWACPKSDPAPPPPPRDGKLGAQRCSGKPGPKNALKPLLQRPFDGHYPVYNLFDHDLPLPGEIRAAAVADKELTYCGIQALGLAEGYPGYAFGLPAGTPVFAAADGEVIAAGTMAPFACPLTMRLVEDQTSVDLRHDTLGGIGFITRYVHLSKALVKPGDQVVAGQRIGLSGQSGCALQPLLYFEVKRLTGTRTGNPSVVDPYGWDGPGEDPWAQNERGAASMYLWKDGEAPTLKAK